MTDLQFKAFRRIELLDFKSLLACVKKAEFPNTELVEKLENLIDAAERDLE